MHTFWLILLVFILIWYIVVTFVVAVKGAKDIRNMIKK